VAPCLPSPPPRVLCVLRAAPAQIRNPITTIALGVEDLLQEFKDLLAALGGGGRRGDRAAPNARSAVDRPAHGALTAFMAPSQDVGSVQGASPVAGGPVVGSEAYAHPPVAVGPSGVAVAVAARADGPRDRAGDAGEPAIVLPPPVGHVSLAATVSGAAHAPETPGSPPASAVGVASHVAIMVSANVASVDAAPALPLRAPSTSGGDAAGQLVAAPVAAARAPPAAHNRRPSAHGGAVASSKREGVRAAITTLTFMSISVRQVQRLLDSFLDVEKLQAGLFAIDLVLMSPLKLLETALQQLLPNAAHHRIKMRLECDADVPELVLGDFHRLLQVSAGVWVGMRVHACAHRRPGAGAAEPGRQRHQARRHARGAAGDAGECQRHISWFHSRLGGQWAAAAC
jgi:hypothetical protein